MKLWKLVPKNYEKSKDISKFLKRENETSKNNKRTSHSLKYINAFRIIENNIKLHLIYQNFNKFPNHLTINNMKSILVAGYRAINQLSKLQMLI